MAAKTGTYTLISSNTLGSAAASVTFSSIPSTYTDLILVANLNGSGNANIFVRVNGDSGTNYSNTMLSANGSAASSSRNTSSDSMFMINSGSSLNAQWGTFIQYFMDYSNATTNKTTIARFGTGSGEVTANVTLWRNTAAITSIEVRTSTNSYVAGSTFKLYGIEAGNL